MDDIDKTYLKLKRISYEEMLTIYIRANDVIRDDNFYEQYGWAYGEFMEEYIDRSIQKTIRLVNLG